MKKIYSVFKLNLAFVENFGKGKFTPYSNYLSRFLKISEKEIYSAFKLYLVFLYPPVNNFLRIVAIGTK